MWRTNLRLDFGNIARGVNKYRVIAIDADGKGIR